MNPSTVEHLVNFIEDFRDRSLPQIAVVAAKRDLLDTLGCMIGGSSADVPKRMMDAISPESGQRHIIGTSYQASMVEAARLMSVTAVWLDLDTGLYKHPSLKRSVPTTHSTVHILPAMMADPAVDLTSSDHALRYFALAYEVASRIASATVLRPGVHPHGVAANAGVAVALALLRGYDRNRLYRAIQYASALVIAPPLAAASRGGQVRNVFASVGVEMAWLATRLAELGTQDALNVPAFALSRVAGDSFDDSVALEGLGTEWFLQRGYLKLHACCRFLHPALDALEDLRREQSIPVEEIVAVRVRTFYNAAQLDNAAPLTDLGAKFSVPWGVAASLVLGHSDVSAFSSNALQDVRIRMLAERIEVIENPDYSAQLPHTRRTAVEIHLANGTRLSMEAVGSRGDPSVPYSDADVAQKFLNLANLVLPSERGQNLLRLVRSMDKSPYPMVDLITLSSTTSAEGNND